MPDLPVLYHVVPALRTAPKNFHKYLVLLLTFLAYTSYHLSRQAFVVLFVGILITMYIHFRKPISIVKNSHVFLDCENRTLATHNNTCTSWITQVLISPPRNPKQFLLSSRLMGSLQNQQRPTWGCLTPHTFSPMHSSCSSAGDSFHQDINIS